MGWADAEAGVLIEGQLLRQRGAEPLTAASALEPGGALEVFAVEGGNRADAVPAEFSGLDHMLELFLKRLHPTECEGFVLEAGVEIDHGDFEEGIVDVAIGDEGDAVLAGIGPDGDAVGGKLPIVDEAHGLLGAGDGMRCVRSGFVVHDGFMLWL